MSGGHDFVQDIIFCLRKTEGKPLCKYFSLNNLTFELSGYKLNASDIRPLVGSEFADIIVARIACEQHIKKSEYGDAFERQCFVVESFTKIFVSQKNSNWLLPVICLVCLDLRLLSGKLVSLHGSKKINPSELTPTDIWEKCTDLIMGAFRVCAADNRSSLNESKKWGMMNLANQLIKVYHKMCKYSMAIPLYKAIEASRLDGKFKLADQVTYRFFTGCKAAYDGSYKKAHDDLMYSFLHCYKSSEKNKKRILSFLVPVKLMAGFMPKKEILEKYNLPELWEVSDAIRRADIKKLREVISENIQSFLKAGNYMIIEKLQCIAYRNLFKKVYLTFQTNILPLPILLTACQLHEPETTMPHLECWLTNLIYSGKIKGYISHGHQKIVFSKVEAFPKLSSLTLE